MRIRIRRSFTYANVMATLAVFVALGGTSFAAATLLTGANIKDGSLTTKDVKDRSLLARDFAANQLPKGAAGAPGAVGPQGLAGTAGTNGTSGSPDSPAQVLAKLATVDGAASGLDADTVDGLSSGSFLAATAKAADADELDGYDIADFRLTCAAGWSLFGGQCWQNDDTIGFTYVQAAASCAGLGGRLPLMAELTALIATPTHPAAISSTVYDWAADAAADGSSFYVATITGSDSDGIRANTVSSFRRCVRPPAASIG